MIDNSWIFGYVITACFSVGIVALTLKGLAYLFSNNKDKKEER